MLVGRGLADEGRTMLLVTHEMHFAREVSDQLVYLDQGRIAASGAPQDVFEDPRCRHFVAPAA